MNAEPVAALLREAGLPILEIIQPTPSETGVIKLSDRLSVMIPFAAPLPHLLLQGGLHDFLAFEPDYIPKLIEHAKGLLADDFLDKREYEFIVRNPQHQYNSGVTRGGFYRYEAAHETFYNVLTGEDVGSFMKFEVKLLPQIGVKRQLTLSEVSPRMLFDFHFAEVDKNIDVFINPVNKVVKANYRSEDAADEIERRMTTREVDTIIALGKALETLRGQ